jgi:hypothetical protein
LIILPRIHSEGIIFLFLLGTVLLVVLFLHLPRFSPGGLEFLLHLLLEDLIVLTQVAPMKLESQVILLLLVFKFLLEVNLKLEAITQYMDKVSLDYNINLGFSFLRESTTSWGETSSI